MKKTDLHGKTKRRNPILAGTREGDGPTHVAPAFHCPSCEQPIPAAAEFARQQERFLKRLFERHDELQRSLASTIHDDLAQQLAAALFYLEGSRQVQTDPLNDGHESFHKGLKLLRDGIQTARRIAGRLQPLIDREGEIELGIEYLIHEMQSRDGPKIVFQVQGEAVRIASELERSVFCILRELLANACRHSGSEEVRLTVACSTDCLRLEVEDWGVGFDLENVKGKAFGLVEIRQRAKLLGGNAAIDSVPGQGTRVVVSLPIAAFRSSEP